MSSWNRSQNRSLISVACGDGVTNSVPVSVSASVTCSTTSGLRCPTSIAPKPIDRSSSRLPSTSVSHAPSRRRDRDRVRVPVLERARDPERQRLAGPLVVRARPGRPRGEPLPLRGEQALDDRRGRPGGSSPGAVGRCRGRGGPVGGCGLSAGRSWGLLPHPRVGTRSQGHVAVWPASDRTTATDLLGSPYLPSDSAAKQRRRPEPTPRSIPISLRRSRPRRCRHDVPARPGALAHCQYRLVCEMTRSGVGAPYSLRSSVVCASPTRVTS